MADQAMSLSAQPHTVLSPLSVTLPQLPPFSLTTLTTQNEQLMPNRQLYSLLTEPSVSWTGQRPHISVGARHSKTPGELVRVSSSTGSVPEITLSGSNGRSYFTNARDRDDVILQNVPSVNQGPAVPSPLNLGVLANQVPPLPRFSGETDSGKGDSETFADWRERFEMVAEVYQWDQRAKLVNLVTRLCGQAYSFYRSCDIRQRSNYTQLVEELSRHFTPVRIRAVQSSLFHDRQQKEKESVDDYTQELRSLFQKAYPQAMQGTTDLEDISKSILCNQFVAGLLPDIKIKIAGTEGSFETLLTKARFEEAKLWELGKSGSNPSRKQNLRFNAGGGRGGPSFSNGDRSTSNVRCYKCGSLGHVAANCPQKGRKSRESQRPNQQSNSNGNNKTVNSIVAESKKLQQDKIDKNKARVAELQKQLQDAEREAALTEQTRTMHGITCSEQQGVRLGPTPTTEVNLEGTDVQALLDTGSPVTIVSVQFLFQALAKHRLPSQSIEEWQDSVRARLQHSNVTLQSYGGGKLNIIGQIEVTLERGSHRTKALVQIQNKAPVQLLIGTDLLPSLGVIFLLEQSGAEQSQIQYDLLQENTWNLQAREFVPTKKEHSCERQEKSSATTAMKSVSGYKNNSKVKECDNSKPEDSSFLHICLSPTEESAMRDCLSLVEESAITVCLLQATRLPGRHEKLLKLQVGQQYVGNDSHMLLEPDHLSLKQLGLEMESALLKLDKNGCAVLPVGNYSTEVKHLDKGQVVGRLCPVTLASSEADQASKGTQGSVEVRVLDATVASRLDEDHWNQLCKVLRVGDTNSGTKPDANSSEISKFYEILKPYANVFMFEDGELGSTNVVTHSIDTGDSAPIKQPARRIPFALCKKVEQLVDGMLQKKLYTHQRALGLVLLFLWSKRMEKQDFMWTTGD